MNHQGAELAGCSLWFFLLEPFHYVMKWEIEIERKRQRQRWRNGQRDREIEIQDLVNDWGMVSQYLLGLEGKR